MSFSCPTKSLCQDPSTPFLNTTAEAPDSEIYIGRNTGYGPSYPPLGQDWTQLGCTVTCESKVSQEDADQCAANNWADCISDKWPPLPPLPPVYDRFGRRVPNPLPRPIFRSAPQSVTLHCPDGLPFVYNVPAGKFSGFSQAQADAEAKSFAQQNAPKNQICLSALTPPTICAGVAYAGTITASGGHLEAVTACWTVLGQLPPGIHSDLDFIDNCFINGLTLHFSGTSYAPGIYNFAVQIADGLGDYMVKPVTLKVAGISNIGFPDATVGTSYSQNVSSLGVTNPIYSLEAGALPDGLTLDPTGVIFGTPTVGGDFNFTLGVTEAGTGQTCLAEFEINAAGATCFSTGTNLPPGATGVAYETTLMPIPTLDPGDVWNPTLASGTLPPGLLVSVDGGLPVILGTPTTPGTYCFVVQLDEQPGGGGS